MPAPRPPEFRRRAVELARPRKEADRPDRQEPGIAGIMPARLDGPGRRRRGLVRELAVFVMEMTLPAIVVSVIRAAAAGWPAPGTKAIQRVLPAGQEGAAAGRHFLTNSTAAGSRGGRHPTMLPRRARRRDGGGCRARAGGGIWQARGRASPGWRLVPGWHQQVRRGFILPIPMALWRNGGVGSASGQHQENDRCSRGIAARCDLVAPPRPPAESEVRFHKLWRCAVSGCAFRGMAAAGRRRCPGSCAVLPDSGWGWGLDRGEEA